MSLTYNGTTSVLASDATQVIGSAFSGAIWMFPNSMGESNEGMLLRHGPTGGITLCRFLLWWGAAGTNKLQFRSSRSTAGKWDMTSGFAALNTWLWVGFTYDGSSTANDPIFYTLVGNVFSVLTVGSGLTETSTPSGSESADTKTFAFGNSPTDLDNTFDGLLGEGAFWKRICTGDEMRAVAFAGVNAVPDHFNYLHQTNGSVQNLGSSGQTFTATNTSVGENPPIRCAGRR